MLNKRVIDDSASVKLQRTIFKKIIDQKVKYSDYITYIWLLGYVPILYLYIYLLKCFIYRLGGAIMNSIEAMVDLLLCGILLYLINLIYQSVLNNK